MPMRPRKRRSAGALAAFGLVLASGGGRAEAAAAKARLEYARAAGTETCPDEAVVREAVKARLGFDPFQSDAARTVRADVTRQGAVFRVRVRVTDEAGIEVGVRKRPTHEETPFR